MLDPDHDSYLAQWNRCRCKECERQKYGDSIFIGGDRRLMTAMLQEYGGSLPPSVVLDYGTDPSGNSNNLGVIIYFALCVDGAREWAEWMVEDHKKIKLAPAPAVQKKTSSIFRGSRP